MRRGSFSLTFCCNPCAVGRGGGSGYSACVAVVLALAYCSLSLLVLVKRKSTEEHAWPTGVCVVALPCLQAEGTALRGLQGSKGRVCHKVKGRGGRTEDFGVGALSAIPARSEMQWHFSSR